MKNSLLRYFFLVYELINMYKNAIKAQNKNIHICIRKTVIKDLKFRILNSKVTLKHISKDL